MGGKVSKKNRQLLTIIGLCVLLIALIIVFFVATKHKDNSEKKEEAEIIAASVRNPIHVTDCALAGADIATVPYSVIEQMTKHPLTDQGIEKFQKDYIAVFGK